MKTKSSFVCQECGYDSPKFLGKCPECGEWNSFREVRLSQIPDSSSLALEEKKSPQKLSQVDFHEKERLSTGFSEMDNVLGGGIVEGSVILLSGDPGIGKSTLLLQTALNVARDKTQNKDNRPVLYISSEESEQQIKLRASRIVKDFNIDRFLLISISNTDAVLSIISEVKPKLVIMDSIQTLESENAGGLSGSVSQVRYATSQLVKLAKTRSVPVIIVGHVTKEGMVAGPMMLSHMVDVVLFLEGEKLTATRILRGFKNRFGSVDEVGIFLLEQGGMMEAKNPQQLFYVQNPDKKTVGAGITIAMEGKRAFPVEIQSLVVPSKIPIPRRVASGMDPKRLELILAVLQRHARIPIYTYDVFLSAAGGIKISDPAADLGAVISIISSFKNVPASSIVGISEVGLLGELRSVPFLDKRIKEAEKLGFTRVISAKTHKNIQEVIKSLKI